MNRNLTLIISAVLVVVLLAVWLYLVFFSNKGGDEAIEETGTYTEFDSLTGEEVDGTFGSDVEGSNSGSPEIDEDGNVVWPILRQLTSRNVIGYQEVEIASTTHIIFAESGVGHIYSLNLETGEEERVTVTTIPNAREAHFSPDGNYIVVKTGDSAGVGELSIGKIDYETNEVSLTSVENQVDDFVVTDDGYLLFGSVTNNSVVVKSLLVGGSGGEKVVFTTPFREAKILFGKKSTDEHYFLPKTSHLLEGFVYKVSPQGVFSRLTIDGFGFSSANTNSHLVSTYREQSSLVTKILNKQTEVVVDSEMSLIPQKCVSSNAELYCAVPGNKKLQYNSLDRWLQGVDSYADNLWRVDDDFEELVNITEFSGRNVDVVNGVVGELSADWYFQNKTDNSLWVYELSRATEEPQENI